MSDYNRTTRECSVSQLQPELRQAIRRYFEEHELGDPEAETLLCCETLSEKKNFNGLASLLKDGLETTIHTGMLFTSQWLIWVRKGDQSEAVINAARLKEIQVRAYMSILTRDTGMEIFGQIGNSKIKVRGYIGMGAEAAAQNFCKEVHKAVSSVMPPAPPKTYFQKLMGG